MGQSTEPTWQDDPEAVKRYYDWLDTGDPKIEALEAERKKYIKFEIKILKSKISMLVSDLASFILHRTSIVRNMRECSLLALGDRFFAATNTPLSDSAKAAVEKPEEMKEESRTLSSGQPRILDGGEENLLADNVVPFQTKEWEGCAVIGPGGRARPVQDRIGIQCKPDGSLLCVLADGYEEHGHDAAQAVTSEILMTYVVDKESKADCIRTGIVNTRTDKQRFQNASRTGNACFTAFHVGTDGEFSLGHAGDTEGHMYRQGTCLYSTPIQNVGELSPGSPNAEAVYSDIFNNKDNQFLGLGTRQQPYTPKYFDENLEPIPYDIETGDTLILFSDFVRKNSRLRALLDQGIKEGKSPEEIVTEFAREADSNTEVTDHASLVIIRRKAA